MSIDSGYRRGLLIVQQERKMLPTWKQVEPEVLALETQARYCS
jgi:hypothetical protein